MKGGKLCELYNEKKGEDKYTLGELVFQGIYVDKNNPDVFIKIIQSEGEYALANYLAYNDFVPKIFGYFNCTNTESIAKYSLKQQRIKARNYSAKPGQEPESLGDITYESKKKHIIYMVMERIDGDSLASVDKHELTKYIDEIYRLYNILADKGITLDDLAARNIILSKKGKIYLIDFEPTYTTIKHSAIPINKRHSKETLLKMLPMGPANFREHEKKTVLRKANKKFRGLKSFKKMRKKMLRKTPKR